MNKHFLSITDFSAKEIWQVLIMAKKFKEELKSKGKNKQSSSSKKPLLEGKQMVMLFEKPSLRTKLSFDIGISQLGGHPIYFGAQEVGLGSREDVTDVVKVISSMADLVIARVFSHKQLERFAAASQIPVINALSDKEHPCQILADLLTIYEIKEKLEGLKVTFMGDSKNNVATSLNLACQMLDIEFVENDPKDADVIYTDTWVSMGEEVEAEEKLKQFEPFQVNQKVMQLAKPDAIFMHCLPAHKGQEVTKEVIEGHKSVVFQQAENRLHAQKALLICLFSNIKGGDLYGF